MKKVVKKICQYICEKCGTKYDKQKEAEVCEKRILEKKKFKKGDKVKNIEPRTCAITNKNYYFLGSVIKILGPTPSDYEYETKWLGSDSDRLNAHVFQYEVEFKCPECKKTKRDVYYAPELEQTKKCKKFRLPICLLLLFILFIPLTVSAQVELPDYSKWFRVISKEAANLNGQRTQVEIETYSSLDQFVVLMKRQNGTSWYLRHTTFANKMVYVQYYEWDEEGRLSFVRTFYSNESDDPYDNKALLDEFEKDRYGIEFSN